MAEKHDQLLVDLLEASKLQHEAIDMLFAELVKRDPGFYPTRHCAWDAARRGHIAISVTEAELANQAVRATKAEQELAEWKQRFDLLLTATAKKQEAH